MIDPLILSRSIEHDSQLFWQTQSQLINRRLYSFNNPVEQLTVPIALLVHQLEDSHCQREIVESTASSQHGGNCFRFRACIISVDVMDTEVQFPRINVFLIEVIQPFL